MVKLKKQGLAEQAYLSLRDDILRFRIKPGQRLNISVLRKNMGVSSAPVREAINRLLQDSLVIHDGMKGYFVIKLTPQDIGDLFHLRRIFEIEALSDFDNAPENRKKEITDNLKKLRQRFVALTKQSDKQKKREEFLRLDEELHRAIVGVSKNQKLKDFYSQIWNLVVLVQHMDDHTDITSHITIIDALIKEGDDDKAGELLHLHICHTQKRLMEQQRNLVRSKRDQINKESLISGQNENGKHTEYNEVENG